MQAGRTALRLDALEQLCNRGLAALERDHRRRERRIERQRHPACRTGDDDRADVVEGDHAELVLRD